MNIDSFIAQGLIQSGARPSQFEITLSDWPGSTQEANRRFSFLAKASQIPPSMMGQIDVPYKGRTIKVFGDRQYPNWNVTIYNTTDFLIRQTMEAWHQNINQHIENTSLISTAQTSYKRDATIKQQGKDGSTLATYTMIGIFPVQIDAIALDWEAANQIEVFDVEFSVDYFLPGDQTGRSESSSFPEGSTARTIG